MKSLRRIIGSLVLTLVLPASAFASASDVSEALNVSGNRVVTRGEFLRASVILLNVSVDTKSVPGKYDSYPENLRAYVRAADDEGALGAFGAVPDLTKPITRGEAVEFLYNLRDWGTVEYEVAFRDIRHNSALETAVEFALDHSWIRSLRERTFGVRALLRAREARSLLTRASGDEPGKQIIKVKILKKNTSVVDFTSEKFRTQVKSLLADQYLYAEKLQNGTGTTAQQFVDSLKDPYTTLFDPVAAKEFLQQLEGTLTGIGTHIELKEGALIVVSVIEGSPAEGAGLLSGDKIVTVNRKTVLGLSFNEAIRMIRGPEGTTVQIGVYRGMEKMTFTMKRAVIDIPDTKVEFRSNVAIVTVSQFGDHLQRDSDQIFRDIAVTNPVGIILDLRNNPGGYLEAGAELAGAFLPNGSIYVKTKGKSFRDSYVTQGEMIVPEDVPVVVLVNNGSASAAEIVAGALQDHDRATLLGTKTFGKGTVQTIYPFQNKSSLKFTIAEWLTPDGNPINEVGIMPDVQVEQSDAGDMQLERAFELLNASSY